MSTETSKQVIIREAELTDAEAINSLSHHELGYPFDISKTVDTLRSLLSSDKDRIFVACIDNEVVGYVHACYYVSLYEDKTAAIIGIAVSSNHKRKGIGNILLRSIEKWSQESELFGVRLLSGEERLDAHKFYKRCGYTFDKKQAKFSKLFK